MPLPRRQLLKTSTILCLGLPSFSLLATQETADLSKISYVKNKNQHAAPLLEKGDFVLVDPNITSFQQDGIYLYPNWGDPIAYHVSKNNRGRLEFYSPNKTLKLWETLLENDQAIFSGKAIGFVSSHNFSATEELIAGHTELNVPHLPLV